jgi:hypothetical protein
MRKGHIVISGLSGSTVLVALYLIKGTIFLKKKKLLNKKMFVSIFSTTFV